MKEEIYKYGPEKKILIQTFGEKPTGYIQNSTMELAKKASTEEVILTPLQAQDIARYENSA